MFDISITKNGYTDRTTADEVEDLTSLIKSLTVDASLEVSRAPEPLATFDVFYGSDYIGQGWTNHRVVEAKSFECAMRQAMARSQHQTGRRYLIVGEKETSYGTVEKVGRVFEITRHDVHSDIRYKNNAVVTNTPFAAPGHEWGYYTFREVLVV